MDLQSEIQPELWNCISKSYESEIYSTAILEAVHHLSSVLRERADVDGDGFSLVGQALGGKEPRLRVNKLQTQSEKDEQGGLEHTLRGIYLGIRNPRSHEQIEDTQATANAIILFINYVLFIIGKAKEPFTIEEWSAKVFDPDFVASARYAKLLASEVPSKKLTDALITIYRDKLDGDGEKLRYIFSALIELANENQLQEFLSAVSHELRSTQDDQVIKLTLQVIPCRLWPQVREVARLRIENKLISSIEVGQDFGSDETDLGWLGTWARDFIKFFTLKFEVRRTFLKKLQGTEEEQNYIAKFLLSALPDSLEQNDWSSVYHEEEYIAAIANAVICSSDYGLFRKEPSRLLILPRDWLELIIAGLEPLKESQPKFYEKFVDAITVDEYPF